MNIIREIREEIRTTYKEPTSREMTILAILLFVIPGLIGLYKLFWTGSQSGYYWIGAGAAIFASRVITPFFRRFYRAWVSMAVVIGYIVSRILMTLIFALVVIPTGLLMRLFGKDPMDRNIDPEASTYWIKREAVDEYSVERYEKQF